MLEIVLGIVLGPSVLGWLEPDLAVQIVALLGLAMLLFLAGLEIDLRQLRGRLLAYAVLLLSLVFSESGGSTGSRVVLLGLFALLIVLVAAAVALSSRSMRLSDVLVTLQDTTAEIRVRGAMVMLIAFVVLAERFGLESILGAFMAGAAVGILDRDASTHPQFRVKLDAIGYGFLIPVFFVASGNRLDVAGLLDDPAQLGRVPVFLGALLLARGVPALLYLRWFGARGTAAAALLQATSLPFIVTATQIGVVTGRIEGTTAAGLVCAGLVSVLVFPASAASLGLRGSGEKEPTPSAATTEPPG